MAFAWTYTLIAPNPADYCEGGQCDQGKESVTSQFSSGGVPGGGAGMGETDPLHVSGGVVTL